MIVLDMNDKNVLSNFKKFIQLLKTEMGGGLIKMLGKL